MLSGSDEIISLFNFNSAVVILHDIQQNSSEEKHIFGGARANTLKIIS